MKQQTAPKKKQEVHIYDIPKKYFPKKTKSQEYADELVRMMSNLRYTNEKVQHSAQLCSFDITALSKKQGFRPLVNELFKQVAEFVYHYENYCFRAYSFREKTLKFINSILMLNFDEYDVKMKFIKNHPIVKQAGLVPMLNKFETNRSIKKIIEDRSCLTHKLYYGKKFDHYFRPTIDPARGELKEAERKRWRKDWKKEIQTRAKMTDEFTDSIFDMNHILARKIMGYRDMSKKKTTVVSPKEKEI
jgi:hypothetical protein